MMKKWIRWPGVIAFFVVLALLTVFFIFFAGTIIEFSIFKNDSKTDRSV
jgi:hypothetical protein